MYCFILPVFNSRGSILIMVTAREKDQKGKVEAFGIIRYERVLLPIR
jgi:hypothetical protein